MPLFVHEMSCKVVPTARAPTPYSRQYATLVRLHLIYRPPHSGRGLSAQTIFGCLGAEAHRLRFRLGLSARVSRAVQSSIAVRLPN